ncbi:TonB-dependent receptor [Spirosoma arboris]|nr:TonB-dependent receptor [Spirosoma arboris]
MILSGVSAVAQTGRGTIRGTVTTADSKPAAFVTILIKGTNRGSLTDETGQFTIKNVPTGPQSLLIFLIGYQPEEHTLQVQAGEIVAANVQLAETAQQLDEIVVSGLATNRFAQKETDYIARMPLKNLENPQVYTVIPKELLKEQVAVSINNALSNATGAAPVTYPAGGFGITSRGFSTGINARNGLETAASRSSVDIGNVERIEVIKGPSGTLFGSSISSFGGVVNLVTKKPFETAQTEVGYTFGSYGLNRFTVDVNTPVNAEKTALFRINAAVNRQNSFLNYGYNNTLLIAPSFSYKVSDRLTVLADAEYLGVNQTRSTYTRVTAASGIDNPAAIPLDYRKSLYLDDANAITTASKFFLQANYKLSSSWTSSTLFSFVSENAKQSYQYYPTWISPTSVARNILIYGPIYNNYTNLQQNFTGTLTTGPIDHKILLGVNYRFYNGEFNYASSGSRFVDTVNVTKTFTALNKAKIDQFMLTYGSVIPFGVSDQSTYSVYGSDVLTFSDRLSAMLSLRLDRYDYKGVSGTDAYGQTSLAPKLGLVYQLVKDQVSIFGNYMSGFQNSAPVNQPDGSLLVLRPIYANQSEGGIKAEAFGRKLNLSLSYYYIAIKNATRTDAKSFTYQDGEQVSKGFEVELIANPVRGLNLVLGYAYNDNRIVKASDASISGNKAANAPTNVFNGWLSYKFQGKVLKGLGLGFGGNYVDKNFLTTANTYYLPAYTALNGTLFYEQPRWRFGLKLNNLGDQCYWDLYGSPQAPRNLAANLTVRF